MGLVPLTLEMLLRHVGHVGGLNGRTMLEFGDQQMYCHRNIPEGSPAKSWFERNGVQHTSVDLNGELGAMALDLSKPLPAHFKEHFDVVTDFGTSEHVGKELAALYGARSNAHNACRVGGLMIFVNPRKDNWPGHGYHYFTREHYERLARACGYQVLEISENPTLGNAMDGWQVHAAFLRGEKDFPSFGEFLTICEGTVFAK